MLKSNNVEIENAPRLRSVRGVCFALLGSLVLLGTIFSNQVSAKNYWVEKSASDGINEEAVRLNALFTDLAQKLSPTVVNVYTKVKVGPRQGQRQGPRGYGTPEELFRFFFGNPFEDRFGMPQPREAQSLGSGFLINDEGLIVTNSHVVRLGDRLADEVSVKFIGGDKGQGFAAEVVGVDQRTDVALLRLKGKRENLRSAPLGDSDKLTVGHWVIAIGNPYGHSHTVTQGIVSAVGRSIEDLAAEFIQTSASINPGNSGGPLFNLNGEVVGINTAIDPRAQGIGFAIPINRAKMVIRQLVEKGKVERGWLGVGIADLTPQLSEYLKIPGQKGVLVREVFKGEPAEKAGLEVYDVITKVNGKEIDSANALAIAVGDVQIGKFVELEVIRDGTKKNFKVKVGERKSEMELAEEDSNENGGGKGGDLSQSVGVVVGPLTKKAKLSLGLPPDLSGALIESVTPYSVAQQAGIQAGDVITEVNRVKITSAQQAQKVMEAGTKKGGQLLLKIQRRYGTAVVLLDLSE